MDKENSNLEALQSMVETKKIWQRRLDNLNSVISLAVKGLSGDELEEYLKWSKEL